MQKKLYLDEYKTKKIAPTVEVGVIALNQTITFSKSSRLFDIASLTKVVNTYYLIKLFEERNISLDIKLSELLDTELDITVKQLLTHTSSLADVKLDNYELNNVLNNLVFSNSVINYADVNFILIYYILESLVTDVCNFIETRLKVNGIHNMVYTTSNKSTKDFIQSEEKDRSCCGVVNDSKAYLMDGKSSHAGLFSNLDSLLKFGNLVLNDAEFRNLCFEEENLVYDNELIRTLGFEIKDQYNQFGSNGKQLFHTGFTGTSLLIDYKNNSVIVILTNYLMNGREPEKIQKFRKYVHQEIYDVYSNEVEI